MKIYYNGKRRIKRPRIIHRHEMELIYSTLYDTELIPAESLVSQLREEKQWKQPKSIGELIKRYELKAAK